MNRFENIHVHGFRRLYDVELKLKPLNVVIGANGSGKTSLLDVFSLLAASASGRLKVTLSDLGGIDTNITNLLAARGDSERFVSFNLAMSIPGSFPIKYNLSMIPAGVGYRILDESLTQQRGNKPELFTHLEAHDGFVRYFVPITKKSLVQPNWDYDQTESALSQVPKMYQEPEDFRKRLASSTHYHVLDVGPRAPIRLPQQMRDAQLPGHDGEDLVSCLYTLRETDPDRFETIEAALRAGFPDFERLNFPPVAAGTLAMTWKDKTSKNPFFMHQLSEGTLRFLWLATLLQSPGLTTVTMIDEPEVSLHPELLSLLADLLREASARTQLIVATHADRLIRFLKPSEVVTISMNDEGAAEATRADELDLEKWLEEYTLDEVWRMGRMGAAMRIAILVEGKTETAFKPYLLLYLQKRLSGKMPKLDFWPYDGRIPTGDKLKRVVENLLNDKRQPADAVIALTDVYTGSVPPVFPTAEAAKQKMREWVGVEKRFYPHVALHDFEAWLLPYWEKIQKITGSNRKAPTAPPQRR